MQTIDDFLNNYNDQVRQLVNELREYIKQTIPAIREELDVSARLIGFGFGTGYKYTVCAAILSKTGVKLGFYKGAEFS